MNILKLYLFFYFTRISPASSNVNETTKPNEYSKLVKYLCSKNDDLFLSSDSSSDSETNPDQPSVKEELAKLKNQKSRISQFQFNDEIFSYVARTYYTNKKDKKFLWGVIRSLNLIWEYFNLDPSELSIFTANAIFSTNGFLFLSAVGTEMYRGRGILQISGEQNYLECGEMFHSNPELLGELTEKAIKASIKFWERLVCNEIQENEGFVLDFDNSLRLWFPADESEFHSLKKDVYEIMKKNYDEVKKIVDNCSAGEINV